MRFLVAGDAASANEPAIEKVAIASTSATSEAYATGRDEPVGGFAQTEDGWPDD